MLKYACEISEKLYFLSTNDKLKESKHFIYINTDCEYFYQGFYNDFGPLKLSCIYQFCQKIYKIHTLHSESNKKIVHVTSTNQKRKVNAAFLNGCYQIAHLDRSALQAYHKLIQKDYRYIPFRDASTGKSLFPLTLLYCLKGFQKAISSKLFNFATFNLKEYIHYDNISYGDIHWIIPKKILAFTGPKNSPLKVHGYQYHTPRMFISIFHKWQVNAIIRLNTAEYDASIFINAGFSHYDLIFPDGGVPSDRIVQRFFGIIHKTDGAVAVHCKAGLGRTGTLIGCYLMNRYGFSAAEAIAWMRICRPGCVIAYQQTWLVNQQGKYGGRIRNRYRTQSSKSTKEDNKQEDYKNSFTNSMTSTLLKFDGAPRHLKPVIINDCGVPDGDMLNCLKSFNRNFGEPIDPDYNSDKSLASSSISAVILDYGTLYSKNRCAPYQNYCGRTLNSKFSERIIID